MNFTDWIALGQLLAAPALAGVAYYLRGLGEKVHTIDRTVEARVGGVEKQLRELNGRMVAIETWRHLHEAQDKDADRRHQHSLDVLRDEVRVIRDAP